METKTCTKCGEVKALEEFHLDARHKDGRSSACGACRSRKTREWYRENLGARQEADRQKYLRNQEKRRQQALEYDRKQRELRPEHIRARQAAYMRGYRVRNIARQKDLELQRDFGISLVEYGYFMDAQADLCAICGGPPVGRKYLSVDHCHGSGRIRGLLCKPCNLALGNLRDDPVIAMNAALYLERCQ